MDARQSRRGKRISLQQEKRAAADLGGRTMAASGATRLGGGADVRLMGKIRLECKVTEKDEYLLKFSELEKLRKQAIKVLEAPVLQFAFRHINSQLTRYAVIPWAMGDRQKANDTGWFTSARSVRLKVAQLEEALAKGRVMFSFFPKGQEQLERRIFEILHWDKFVERHNANA